MNDFEKLKNTLKDIGCNFVSCQTLIGFDVEVQIEVKVLSFEFDNDGKFLRII